MTMQETLHLHFLSNPKPSFPHLNHHHSYPLFSSSRTLNFPSCSSKSIAVSLPSKPTKTQEISPLHHQNTPPQDTHLADFQEKMFYLDSLGLDVFSLMTHHRPIILSSSIDDVKSTIGLLTSMGFTSLDFRRIASMCPEILQSKSSTILPIFTFLLREAGVGGSDLKRVIHRRPRLLVSSIKHCLRPALYFLQSMGIAEVNKHTYLLSCSVEDKLIPRIQYFEKIGFSGHDARSMFRRFPQLFNYSIKDNVEPKLNYFVVEMGRDLNELKEFPQYFSFSLENRIKPRHQCCVEKGVCFPLHVLLKMTEAQFRSRIEKEQRERVWRGGKDLQTGFLQLLSKWGNSKMKFKRSAKLSLLVKPTLWAEKKS